MGLDSGGQTPHPRSTRNPKLFLLLPIVFFGVPALVYLTESHYWAAYWCALPSVASLLMLVSPSKPIVVRVPTPETPQEPVNLPWLSYVTTWAGLAWVLTLPTVAVLRVTVHHHHELAVFLGVLVPAAVAAGLAMLARARVAGIGRSRA
jgi:hypothetical protein